MTWTEDDRNALLAFKDAIDSDDIKIKERIKKVLLNNRYIIHVLNNKELEDADAEPDDYFNVNIFPMYMVPEIQSSVENFICYEVDYELARYATNAKAKNMQIIFHVLCQKSGVIDSETGIARHDLLAALIQNDFNWTNFCGQKMFLVSDMSGTTDTNYATRTLIFRQYADNNLVKSSNVQYEDGNMHYVPMLANKDIHTVGDLYKEGD